MRLIDAAKRDPMASAIIEALESQLTIKSREIIERHRKQVADELEAMRAEVVASTAMRIARYTQVEMAQDRLILTVEMKGKQ